MRDFHYQHRGKIIEKARNNVHILYGFNNLPPVKIARCVDYLLYQDRFLCKEDKRPVSISLVKLNNLSAQDNLLSAQDNVLSARNHWLSAFRI